MHNDWSQCVDWLSRNDVSRSVNHSTLNLRKRLTATFYSDSSVDISSNSRDRKMKVLYSLLF